MIQTIGIRRDAHAAQAARGLLRDVGGAFAFDDAELLVTELVTNAVRHGAGDTVRLMLKVNHEGGLRCEVVDDGDGFVPPADRDGFGLLLVDKLSDTWGVYTSSTHVWFELGPAPSGSPRF